MADNRKKSSFQGSSITSRYSRGYLLVLFLLIVIFTVSFACSRFLSVRYERMLDKLLDINQMFISVEDSNRYIYHYYSFLHPESGSGYQQARKTAKDSVEVLQGYLKTSYSRELMDLCCMVQSYLDYSTELVNQLKQYTETENGDISQAQLSALYNETQGIYSCINEGFQKVYAGKLDEAQDTYVQISQYVKTLLMVQVAALLAAVFISIIYYRWLMKGIAQPLQKLTHFAEQVSCGPMEHQTHVEIGTGDELELFANAFNEMLDTVHQQMERIEQDSKVREQLQQAEIENLRINAALQSSQMKLLQSRINPHFLYNTLNMIVQTARLEDAEETAELMEVTAEMMRYNLSRLTKVVTLADELRNTQDYIYIQKRRFGKRFRFAFEVDDSCTGVEVPCLVLQPLVENSITHGVGHRIEGGQVTVRVYRVNSHVCVDVMDNGVGIDLLRLQELSDTLRDSGENSDHIGLRNVYQRLRLHFGESLNFTITSVPGNTVIHMEIPG